MGIDTVNITIEKNERRKKELAKKLEIKIAYFQNKLEIVNNSIDTEWLKMGLINLEELKKLATSDSKEDIKDFIIYLAKVKDEFDLKLERIESDMYGDRYWQRYNGKVRMHLFLSMKSMLKFAYENCKSKYYYQRAFWQCGDDEFALDMLINLKGGLA